MNRWWLLAIGLNTCALASNIDTKSWLDKFNVVSNTTSSEFADSQLGVHYIGGSNVTRTNVVSVNPIHVSLPSVSAGCGGIDYTLGGINIASKGEIKKALKSIVTNGAGYAFMLGIETVSPTVSSTMKDIQSWANQLNQININSCELGATIVQGVWPKNTAAKERICSHVSTSNALFRDHIEARHGCRDSSEKKASANGSAKKEGMLAGNYNVAWEVLKKIEMANQTRMLFLNLTGTIIVKDDEVVIRPPKFEEGFHLLMKGGVLENAYHVSKSDKDGIEMTTSPLSISREKSFVHDVQNTLSSLQNKIVNEGESQERLTAEERNLILNTRFPIGSLLSLMGQWTGKGVDLASIHDCGEIIAFERVISFIEEIIQKLQASASGIRSIQVDGDSLNQYIASLDKISDKLRDLQIQNHHKIQQKHQMIQYLISMERELREKERGL
ncbi:MAG: conjugal transfer protein TraH [Rhabdochlamydiaceae bacterium]|nr:conjugal transfer protein TraH [Candidatus Amphrikana amoebophyrae]